jgi:hypothetical protein
VFTAGFIALSAGSTLLAAETPKPQTSKPSENVPSLRDKFPSFTDKDNNTYTIGPDGKLIKTPAPKKVDDPVFAAFEQWVAKYNAANASQKKQLEAEGVKLATERRAALAKLIKSDPQRAIEFSVNLLQRQALPAAVAQQLEDILQGRGNYSVIHMGVLEKVPVAGKPGETQDVIHHQYKHFLTFQGQSYTAHTYGKRSGLLSKNGLPFYGIAIDGNVAIDENPIWVLKPGQAPPPDATPGKNGTKCPICGQDAANGLVGVVGSTLYYFDTQQDLMKFAESLWEAESEIGPKAHG